MTNKNTFFLLITISCLQIQIINAHYFDYDRCDPTSCPSGPITLYEDLHCKPKFLNKSDCCPAYYNCSRVFDVPLNKHCYKNDKVYNIYDKINASDIGLCDKVCKCQLDIDKNEPFIHCAQMDCKEDGYEYGIRKNHYVNYLTQSCCTNTGLPYKNVNCMYDSRSYGETEIFSPYKEPYTVCQCQRRFTNETSKQFCKEVRSSCNDEYYYRKILHNKCAPIFDYLLPQVACVFAHRCYEKGMRVIKENTNPPITSETCKFGELEFNIGDKLDKVNTEKREFSCLNCICKIPPTLTCTVEYINDCKQNNTLDYQIVDSNYEELIRNRRNNELSYLNKLSIVSIDQSKGRTIRTPVRKEFRALIERNFGKYFN